ncbi:DUF4184 family protein [Microbacterium dextranolyticum]|uniref:DUF4184 family protein n=1 Tax=Microbacterium dextranolyticum TaxID=36806 RepID=A0A9W6HQE8_9MICO|nr:DUF4184 family protein [Microbacterium dextranolyticum]MBM7462468.1 hypothetical protein [Microbacterium dextranolyticum]GLJ96699.1 hypothetical protein GCM10017591_27620 [Microbacterium dextranolyticum]
MPFTPSHAVVALPFMRTPLLPAAIAVGAMTPDLPLFLRGGPITYQSTHTNVLLSTVIALILLACWYVLLRPAVRELAPAWLGRRLPPEWDRGGVAAWRAIGAPRRGARSPVWRRPLVGVAVITVSLALGVLSHIAWDAFTHEGRWGTALVPALVEPWGPLLGITWVQHGSSAAGLVLLAVSGSLWLRGRRAGELDRILPSWVRIAWWLSLPASLVLAWGIGLIAYGPLTPAWTVQHLAYRVLPPACGIWGALTLMLCLIVLARRRALPAPAPATP